MQWLWCLSVWQVRPASSLFRGGPCCVVSDTLPYPTLAYCSAVAVATCPDLAVLFLFLFFAAPCGVGRGHQALLPRLALRPAIGHLRSLPRRHQALPPAQGGART